ncbi:hypothetical protein [Brucella pecoris]|jgi:hypothetical protein|uniref:Uncharacterized protein n=1 Tax=Brucella pecoris TaxID=867683 RepID=A0AB34YV87_9HYPH|nr:hypothetical protein [Brucella pecoris]MBB4094904.1 hypothetical protein [Brucella pecoris]
MEMIVPIAMAVSARYHFARVSTAQASLVMLANITQKFEERIP